MSKTRNFPLFSSRARAGKRITYRQEALFWAFMEIDLAWALMPDRDDEERPGAAVGALIEPPAIGRGMMFPVTH
jgi:hypothetical protein